MQKVVKKKSAKKVITKKNFPTKSPKKSGIDWIKVLAIGNILAFIAVLIINYLAVSMPIGGMTTGALSDLYPNLFTPAGLTFSIRGLIYTMVLSFVVWQIVDLFKKQTKGITKKIWIWFLLSCTANISWIFARHFQQVFLSVLVMLAFLVILIVLASKVQLGKKLWTWKEKLFVQIPFSLYLWWISVATIANTAARLVHIQRGMFGMTPIFRTILMIIIATLLALIALYKKYNVIFALVVVRAFIGIIIKTLWAEVVYTQIIRTLWTCITVITAGIGATRQKRLKN